MKHEDIIALAMEAGFSTKLGAVWVDHWEVTHLIERFAALVAAALAEPPTNQCGETCERAKLCAACARELAEPVQEQPTCDECGRSKRDGWALYCVDCLEPVFAQRKPLTEEEIRDLMADIDPEDVCSWSFRQGVYAAEKHHGIGEP